jgi:prepilin-type N-terminal cleavage/methylation domain-containing protein
MRRTSTQRGFTLVELIMVIVIMGVIGGMVSVFMKSPIDAYVDSARRAALTDVADTAVRRMARDIRKALPNSLRQSIAVVATALNKVVRAAAIFSTSPSQTLASICWGPTMRQPVRPLQRATLSPYTTWAFRGRTLMRGRTLRR